MGGLREGSQMISNAGSDRQFLEGQLDRAVNSASKQDTILWSVFGIFWAAHAVLLVAVFFGGRVADSGVGAVVAAVGLVTAVSSYLLLDRGMQHLNRFHKLQEDIERQLGLDIPVNSKFALSGWINTEAMRRITGFRAQPVMRWMVRGAGLGWAAFLAYFVWQAVQ